MDFTYLDYFNYYLKEFCNEIIANFPDFEKGVVENYRTLLETKQSKTDLFVKYFVSKVNDYMEDICNRNTELFELSRWFNQETQVQGCLYLLEGVDFVSLWNSSHNNEDNQKAIWKYLQLLVLLGRKVVPNREEVLNILNGVGGQVYAPAKVEKTLHGIPDDLEDSGNKPDIFGLGNLASLAGLAGIGSGEMPDLSSIIKTLGDTLGNIDMSEINKQMESAQAATDFNADGNNRTDGTNRTDENENGNEDVDGVDSDTGDQSNENESGVSNSTNNLFTDLAKEMSETFDFSSMEGNEPANMGEAFKQFLSGDNPAKLMGLVSKFGAKLQNDVASGRINQSDLLRDTQKMMAGLQSGDPSVLKKQAQQMAKANPQLAQQVQRMQSGSRDANARARLQAKLAAKHTVKEQ